MGDANADASDYRGGEVFADSAAINGGVAVAGGRWRRDYIGERKREEEEDEEEEEEGER